MPEVILTENPWDNPWGYNPRRRRRGRKGRRRSRNPRGGRRRMGLARLMSPAGITGALDLEKTGGVAIGLIGFQKVSEAIGQSGFLDAALTIGAAALAGSMFGGGRLMSGIAEGGIALGLLKVLMLIPGTSQLVSPGSVVLGGGARFPTALGGGSFPRSGVSNKVTLAG